MPSRTTFRQETADTICEAVADGKTITEICSMDGMPARSTVFKWLAEIEGFSDQYARAKETQMDRMADELLEIADDATNDWMKRRQGDDEIDVANQEHIQRSRLRVDTRKWLMSKLAPKKYGDKQQISGDPDSPLKIVVQRFADDLPAE